MRWSSFHYCRQCEVASFTLENLLYFIVDYQRVWLVDIHVDEEQLLFCLQYQKLTGGTCLCLGAGFDYEIVCKDKNSNKEAIYADCCQLPPSHTRLLNLRFQFQSQIQFPILKLQHLNLNLIRDHLPFNSVISKNCWAWVDVSRWRHDLWNLIYSWQVIWSWICKTCTSRGQWFWIVLCVKGSSNSLFEMGSTSSDAMSLCT